MSKWIQMLLKWAIKGLLKLDKDKDGLIKVEIEYNIQEKKVTKHKIY